MIMSHFLEWAPSTPLEIIKLFAVTGYLWVIHCNFAMAVPQKQFGL